MGSDYSDTGSLSDDGSTTEIEGEGQDERDDEEEVEGADQEREEAEDEVHRHGMLMLDFTKFVCAQADEYGTPPGNPVVEASSGPAGQEVEAAAQERVRDFEEEEEEEEEEVDEDELDLEYSYDDEDEDDMADYLNVDVPWGLREFLSLCM